MLRRCSNLMDDSSTRIVRGNGKSIGQRHFAMTCKVDRGRKPCYVEAQGLPRERRILHYKTLKPVTPTAL